MNLVGREQEHSILATDEGHRVALRMNLSLSGEPAEWFNSWKERGLVASVKDAVLLAFQSLQEKVVEQDLKQAQLRTLSNEKHL